MDDGRRGTSGRAPALYAVCGATVGRAIVLGWRPDVRGLEHVPATGGVILAGNHLSVADEYFLASVVPRYITFMAKADYWKSPLTRFIGNGIGAIPVDLRGSGSGQSALAAAVPVLKSGGVIALYPEGSRSPDGRLYRGRTGVVRLAQEAGVPIVPVGVRGTDRVQPIGARFPRPGKVSFAFGEPMPAGGDIRAVTDDLMARIQSLTGQEYVPEYAR